MQKNQWTFERAVESVRLGWRLQGADYAKYLAANLERNLNMPATDLIEAATPTSQ